MKTVFPVMVAISAAMLAAGVHAGDAPANELALDSSKRLNLSMSKDVARPTVAQKGAEATDVVLNAFANAKDLSNAKVSPLRALASGSSADSSKSGDPRVRRALDSAEVKYTIDKDGDFRIGWNTEDSRDHMVFVNGKTSEFGGMEVREVWAIGFRADSVDANNLQALLELNHSYKLGAWEIAVQNGKTVAIFCVKIPADASGETLRAVSCIVAHVADKVESEATNKDDL